MVWAISDAMVASESLRAVSCVLMLYGLYIVVVSLVVDMDDVKKSANYVEGLVQEEIQKGVPRDRVVVGGFSQGGVVALAHTFLYANKGPIAGTVSMSAWVPARGSLTKGLNVRYCFVPCIS